MGANFREPEGSKGDFEAGISDHGVVQGRARPMATLGPDGAG